MDTYYLFLDESKPNGHNINSLCLAGIIIKKEKYENKIIKVINNLKNEIFSTTDIILHEVDIRNARIDDYKLFRKREIRDKFWNALRDVLSTNDFKFIGASINYTEFKSYYSDDFINDHYFIVTQIVLENFVHFLQNNNGVGSIYIESRNPTDDTNIRNHYHRIIANGTLFLNKNLFQTKLTNMNFLIKADNNIGLQLADFVPGALNRHSNNLKPKDPYVTDIILEHLYDGQVDLKNRFGFKQMP